MKKETKTMLLVVIFFSIIAIGTFMIAFINKIYSMKEVYIANIFIPEGTQIDESNFLKYIAKITIPLSTYKELELMEANSDNQNKIIGKTMKYNREKGDFIRGNSIDIDIEKDALKYKLYKLSKEADGKILLPIFINLPKENAIQTKGIGKYQDYVRVSFFKKIRVGEGETTKLVTRYKNVPIIDFTTDGGYITSLVLALPAELAMKYEFERRQASGVVISFNPFNFKTLKDNEVNVVTSEEIDGEYSQNQIYDMKDIFEQKK